MTTTPEERFETNLRAITDPEDTHLGGLKVRPYTFGSILLCELAGVKMGKGGVANAMTYLYIHSAPIEEVRLAILPQNKDTLLVKVMEFIDKSGIILSDEAKVSQMVEESLRAIELASVTVLPSSREKSSKKKEVV